MVLVHSGAVILPELSERSAVTRRRSWPQRGVEIRLNVRVTGVTDGGCAAQRRDR